MIVNERLTTYIHSLETDDPDFLEDIRRRAVERDVPVIRRETESFLKVMLGIKKPEKILEVGAGVAYSACVMAFYSDAHIKTIENYDKRVTEAAANIEAAGFSERICLVKGDALEVVPEDRDEYDLIFLDAAKGQYIELLPHLMRCLKKDGLLIADNVLQDGELIESRFSVERRQRTIHERMRAFLWEVKHSAELETAVLTVGDGISLSVKK